MRTWDEVIGWYEVLNNDTGDRFRDRLIQCMVRILPDLRHMVEERLPDVRLSIVMLALELRVPHASQAVVLQCVDDCKFALRIKNNQYEVLEEIEADLSNVVEKTIECLERTTKQDQIE